MGQETQGQPPVVGGVAGGPVAERGNVGPHGMRMVKLDPSRSPTELLRDLLATGGYPISMASKVGTEAHNEIRLTEVVAKEMQYGNTELTVTLDGETKDELSKNNTLIDGDKFKHAYSRLIWEDEVKRITAEFVGDPDLNPTELAKQKANYEVDGYRAVSLLLVEKVQKVADIFAQDLYPYGSNPIRADEIDVKDNVFKGMGSLTTVMGKRFIGTTEQNVNINPIAFSMEKPGIGLFEFSAPFVQLDMLKWFYTGVSNVERKAFIVFDLAKAASSISYERSVRRIPQIGRFTFFGGGPNARNGSHGELIVANETTAEPLNIPLAITSEGEIDTEAMNIAFGVLTVNNIVMYNNQYGKPFDRLADHMDGHVATFQNMQYQYDDVEEGIEASPDLVEAVDNIPGYEDTTNLSSRVVGVSLRNDIPLSQAYANRTGVVGNWLIPVEKANLANEIIDKVNGIPDLKKAINEDGPVGLYSDNELWSVTFSGEKDKDVTIHVKSDTQHLVLDPTKRNGIDTKRDSEYLQQHSADFFKEHFISRIVSVICGNGISNLACETVEDTEYVHKRAKVYEIKPRSAFTNINRGGRIRIVYQKSRNPEHGGNEDYADDYSEVTGGGGTEEQPNPKPSGLVTELSGFTPPNSGQMV